MNLTTWVLLIAIIDVYIRQMENVPGMGTCVEQAKELREKIVDNRPVEEW